MEWLALLFCVLALGVFFSSWIAPHELQADSPMPVLKRFRQFRAAAGWALVAGKYSQPGPRTLQPMLLYVEAEFMINRANQTGCYLLSAVCIRLMLRMGLHRDPSKLDNLSPFEGEMRRRMWNLAMQLDLIVSFHMGLPSIVHGIESDCNLPRNLIDEDFDEDSVELPLGRPDTEYTHMSYPIFKSIICRVFGQVVRLAHSLTVPSHAEVMKMDALVEDRWRLVPHFMKARPLEECITDPPMQIVHRFGITSLYQKSRCVLHRRYLVEASPRPEHACSRRVCMSAALALLDYQATIFQATQPGGLLAPSGWFVTGLAMHDFLLAAVIVYLAVQHERYDPFEGELDWTAQDAPLPDKANLLDRLRRSQRIWAAVAHDNAEVKKAADIVAVMLRKIQARMVGADDSAAAATDEMQASREASVVEEPMAGLSIGSKSLSRTACSLGTLMLMLSVRATPPYPAQSPMQAAPPQHDLSRNDLVPNAWAGMNIDSWIPMNATSLDWVSILRQSRAMTRGLTVDRTPWTTH
jgi:hypothetical protein